MDQIKMTLSFVLCFLVYVNTFLSTHCVNSSATEIKCSASDNVKWNKIKRKCVICPDCPPGHFRNLSEPYTRRQGIYGDEQCLQCRPCPEGKYSANGRGECIKCRTNCTEMNREYDETCSSIQDAKCGSCLYGFEDIYGHTLFPCSRKRSFRELETPVDQSEKHQNPPENLLKHNEHPVEANDYPGDGTGKMSHGTTGIISGAASLLILLSLVAVLRMLRKRSLARHNIGVRPSGPYNPVFDLSRDNDIETDVLGEDTIPKTRLQQPDAVRPELGEGIQPPARPELSQPATTIQLNGLCMHDFRTLQLSDGSVVSFQLKKDICNCRVHQQCQCELYPLPEHTMDKSDTYITLVASEVCHDPFPLFRNLGLNDATLYQENNTRDRDPENITQKELVIRLLNIWVEIQSSQATLPQLSQALCGAFFHNINRKIYDLSNNISNNSGQS